jgi:hypothetical protein
VTDARFVEELEAMQLRIKLEEARLRFWMRRTRGDVEHALFSAATAVADAAERVAAVERVK